MENSPSRPTLCALHPDVITTRSVQKGLQGNHAAHLHGKIFNPQE